MAQLVVFKNRTLPGSYAFRSTQMGNVGLDLSVSLTIVVGFVVSLAMGHTIVEKLKVSITSGEMEQVMPNLVNLN